MATLVRQQVHDETDGQTADISGNIPAPFPLHAIPHHQVIPLQQRQHSEPTNVPQPETLRVSQDEAPPQWMSGEQRLQTEDTDALADLIPSIGHVQKSCLMTLNDLLRVPHTSSQWSPIGTSDSHRNGTNSPSTPLHTLLTNLRSRDLVDDGTMIEFATVEAQDETALIRELGIRVGRLADTLSEDDAQLAQSIVALMSYFRRMSVVLSSTPQPMRPAASSSSTSIRYNPNDAGYSEDTFTTLERELSDLRTVRSSSGQGDVPAPGASPMLAVESALLWSRIDEELESILTLSKARNRQVASDNVSILPPKYDDWDYDPTLDGPPQYEYPASLSGREEKEKERQQPVSTRIDSSDVFASANEEKMRLDLDAVTQAIDRLYAVAPQLSNQRVELKTSKMLQMERARSAGSSAVHTPARVESTERSNKGKEKAADPREMERLIEMINKASERKMVDQTVTLKGGLKGQLEKAQVRDQQRRDAFVEKLALHSDAGRYHGQDAVLHPDGTRVKNPEALLSLLEFSRETVPQETLRELLKDEEAMLTLPEFIREFETDSSHSEGSALPSAKSFLSRSSQDHSSEIDYSGTKVAGHSRKKSLQKDMFQEKGRNRSMSAPSLSWLKRSSSRSSLGLGSKNRKEEDEQVIPSGLPADATVLNSGSMEVRYVAEYHENLHHVLVFLSIQGAPPGADIELVVWPSITNREEGELMAVRAGSQICSLTLPAPVIPGKKEVRAQSGHFEAKIPTPRYRSALNSQSSDSLHSHLSRPATPLQTAPLFDATHLHNITPSSFICSSCSLPLVQGGKITTYRDLPSDHWEELVDAWMCHADMKLNEEILKKQKEGFWPDVGEALVGGSYILVDDAAVVGTNVKVADKKQDQEYHVVRCICGSISGRCQQHPRKPDCMVFRMAKYAVRPVSARIDPVKIPLSAFIIEDMNEFVQAHATYRFVILDEEEERPRLLVWLFKPNMRLAYHIPRSYAVPRSGSGNVAKVLYKILKPSADEPPMDLKTVLSKYPGFPQAEYLYYPIMICRRLAGLMKESTGAYPESMRTMTGLDVGWLTRM